MPVPCSDDTQVSVPTYSCEDSLNCSCILPSRSPSGIPGGGGKKVKICPTGYCELTWCMTPENCHSLVQNRNDHLIQLLPCDEQVLFKNPYIY